MNKNLFSSPIATTPELISATRCDASLNFSPLNSWPQGLPAVSVNKVLIAGFEQGLAINYQIEEPQQIAELFRSLYSDLSFSEITELMQLCGKHNWLPIETIVQKFGFQYNDLFVKIANHLQATPNNFRRWCAEKKVGPNDLMPLLSTTTEHNLNILFFEILNLKLSKALGCKALELGIELILLGKSPDSLSAQNLLLEYKKAGATHKISDKNDGELWLEALQSLRYPETKARDDERKKNMAELPWPGHSQARWVRQGDRAGIELKLFVTQPSDLKKYLSSLQAVQNLMEEKPKH